MRGEVLEGRARETRCCFTKAEAEAAAVEMEGDEEGGGKGTVKENVEAAHVCTDVEGMFAMGVVIAGARLRLRESPKSMNWVVRRRPRADE